MNKAEAVEKAKPWLSTLSQMLYILDQPDPRDYVIFASIKYFKYIMKYLKAEYLRHFLGMEEQDFYSAIDRLKDKGWVSQEGEYISPSLVGDYKLDALEGWVSYAMKNIQERKPIKEWSKLMRG